MATEDTYRVIRLEGKVERLEADYNEKVSRLERLIGQLEADLNRLRQMAGRAFYPEYDED